MKKAIKRILRFTFFLGMWVRLSVRSSYDYAVTCGGMWWRCE